MGILQRIKKIFSPVLAPFRRREEREERKQQERQQQERPQERPESTEPQEERQYRDRAAQERPESAEPSAEERLEEALAALEEEEKRREELEEKLKEKEGIEEALAMEMRLRERESRRAEALESQITQKEIEEQREKVWKKREEKEVSPPPSPPPVEDAAEALQDVEDVAQDVERVLRGEGVASPPSKEPDFLDDGTHTVVIEELGYYPDDVRKAALDGRVIDLLRELNYNDDVVSDIINELWEHGREDLAQRLFTEIEEYWLWQANTLRNCLNVGEDPSDELDAPAHVVFKRMRDCFSPEEQELYHNWLQLSAYQEHGIQLLVKPTGKLQSQFPTRSQAISYIKSSGSPSLFAVFERQYKVHGEMMTVYQVYKIYPLTEDDVELLQGYDPEQAQAQEEQEEAQAQA